MICDLDASPMNPEHVDACAHTTSGEKWCWHGRSFFVFYFTGC